MRIDSLMRSILVPQTWYRNSDGAWCCLPAQTGVAESKFVFKMFKLGV